MALDENGKFIDKGRRTAPDTGDISTGGLVPLIGGIVLFLLAAPVAFLASSLFVCIFFTGLMVTGAALACTGRILRALK